MAIDHAPGAGAAAPETPDNKDARNSITSDGRSNTSLKGATADQPSEAHDRYSTTTEANNASTLGETEYQPSWYRRFLRSKVGKFGIGATAALAAGGIGASTYQAVTAPTHAAHGPVTPGGEHKANAPEAYTHQYDTLFAPYITQSTDPDKQAQLIQEQEANSTQIAAISPEEAKKLPPNEAIVWGDCYTAALDGTKPGVLLASSMVNLEKIDPNSNAQDTASGFASIYQQNLYNAAVQVAEHPDQENAIMQAYFPEAVDKMHDKIDPLAEELRNTRLIGDIGGDGYLENVHGVSEGIGSTLKTEKLKDGTTLYSLTIGTLPKEDGIYGGDLNFDASQVTKKETVTFVEYPFSRDPTSPFEGLVTLK